MKIKLIEIIDRPLTINIPVIRKGITLNLPKRISPGEIWDILDEPVEPLDSIVHKVQYSEKLESYLKDNNVPYEVVKCNSCGGRVKKIEFPVLEVVD